MRNVPVSGAVISNEDLNEVIEVVKKGWFTEGEKAKQFANGLRSYIGTRHATLCNSGSSANLLAVTALKDIYNSKERFAVITSATGFPTTVAPIVQNQLVPLFVDADPRTLNPDVDVVLDLLQEKRVQGVILAHSHIIIFIFYHVECINDLIPRIESA